VKNRLADLVNSRAVECGISLTELDLSGICEYYGFLERWNRQINLTSLPLAGFPESTVDRLITEPLVAALMVPPGPVRWVDFGSGGGSPAIPLKLLRRDTKLLMVESRERKAAFLRQAVAHLGLSSAEVATARVEDLANEPRLAARAQLVTVRAVRLDEPVGEASRRLLESGGRLMLFGRSATSEPGVLGYRLLEHRTVPHTSSAVFLLERVAAPDVPRGT
jgi:16S rRNA (guanine527-N7)-methyltransferase